MFITLLLNIRTAMSSNGQKVKEALEKDDAQFHPPIDRRVARTRGLLQHAFLALIVKKGYEAVTIQDICEEADVGRSTFYSHYTGKDDLKRRGLDHIRAVLLARQKKALSASDGIPATLSFSLPMFEHARDHLPLYRALIGSDGAAISLGSIRQIIADLVRAEIKASIADGNRAAHEMQVQFITGAFMSVLTWWLDEGAITGPQEMDTLFRHLALNGLGVA